MEIDLLIRVIAVGFGATLIMDLCAIFLSRAFNIASTNYCLVGRWLRHISNGVFKHPSIVAATPKSGECAIGWVAHYSIGAIFAFMLVLIVTPDWLQAPTLMPALIFGIVTVGFPFLILHPAFGLGVAASKAPNPLQARLRSLINHTVFGVGLYISALLASYFTISGTLA